MPRPGNSIEVISPEYEPLQDIEGDTLIGELLRAMAAGHCRVGDIRERLDAYLDHWHKREGRG